MNRMTLHLICEKCGKELVVLTDPPKDPCPRYCPFTNHESGTRCSGVIIMYNLEELEEIERRIDIQDKMNA